MNIIITDDQGKRFVLEGAGELTPEQVKDMLVKFTPTMNWREIKKEVNNFDISQKAKKLLLKLGKYLMRLGSATLELGHKLLELVVLMVKRHPNVADATVIAALLYFVVHRIPLLGPLLATSAVAIVLCLNAWWDFSRRPTIDPALAEEIHAKAKEVFDAFAKWLDSLKPGDPGTSSPVVGGPLRPA